MSNNRVSKQATASQPAATEELAAVLDGITGGGEQAAALRASVASVPDSDSDTEATEAAEAASDSVATEAADSKPGSDSVAEAFHVAYDAAVAEADSATGTVPAVAADPLRLAWSALRGNAKADQPNAAMLRHASTGEQAAIMATVAIMTLFGQWASERGQREKVSADPVARVAKALAVLTEARCVLLDSLGERAERERAEAGEAEAAAAARVTTEATEAFDKRAKRVAASANAGGSGIRRSEKVSIASHLVALFTSHGVAFSMAEMVSTLTEAAPSEDVRPSSGAIVNYANGSIKVPLLARELGDDGEATGDYVATEALEALVGQAAEA